jgi:quercetin dioxygenase-like cupin family protein
LEDADADLQRHPTTVEIDSIKTPVRASGAFGFGGIAQTFLIELRGIHLQHRSGTLTKAFPLSCSTKFMKKLLITVALIVLAGPAMAQDVMKVIKPEDLVWKEHPVFKGAQIAILVGDPTKAETIVQRVKFPPNFKVPPHTHPYSEVVTVLSGTYWNAMGDDTEKGVPLKPGSVFVLPANHTHHTWTMDEEVILQINFTGPGGINFINPADDPRKN